jgi:hypothetical protein
MELNNRLMGDLLKTCRSEEELDAIAQSSGISVALLEQWEGGDLTETEYPAVVAIVKQAIRNLQADVKITTSDRNRLIQVQQTAYRELLSAADRVKQGDTSHLF